MARKSKGRQKVEMVKMQNESNLQVTFSKRRLGLFKKASELCTLCGVEIAIIVFSPGKKVFSFGHPWVESLIERFLTQNPPPNSGTMQLIEAHRNANVRELNGELTQVMDQLESEKRRGEDFNKTRQDRQTECWWECPVEELRNPQLEQLRVSLEELKKNVIKQAEKILIQTSKPPPLLPPPSYFHGSSSNEPGISPYDENTNIMPHHGYGRGFYR